MDAIYVKIVKEATPLEAEEKMQQPLQMDKKNNDKDFEICIKCRNTIIFGKLMIHSYSEFCVNCAQ